eukprot:TRINITY_DN3099_c0_g1_i1.p1 TRINITY_DN3099_c0_g1~~TRINITY_DN3099_c0_g1_i1.p1  ORF type:complete len:254 (+),score=42.05 TRINITY_DN3099_c0_g1_i1:349-1110(+)
MPNVDQDSQQDYQHLPRKHISEDVSHYSAGATPYISPDGTSPAVTPPSIVAVLEQPPRAPTPPPALPPPPVQVTVHCPVLVHCPTQMSALPLVMKELKDTLRALLPADDATMNLTLDLDLLNWQSGQQRATLTTTPLLALEIYMATVPRVSYPALGPVMQTLVDLTSTKSALLFAIGHVAVSTALPMVLSPPEWFRSGLFFDQPARVQRTALSVTVCQQEVVYKPDLQRLAAILKSILESTGALAGIPPSHVV